MMMMRCCAIALYWNTRRVLLWRSHLFFILWIEVDVGCVRVADSALLVLRVV